MCELCATNVPHATPCSLHSVHTFFSFRPIFAPVKSKSKWVGVVCVNNVIYCSDCMSVRKREREFECYLDILDWTVARARLSRASCMLALICSKHDGLAIKLQFSLSAHSGQIEIELNVIACRSPSLCVWMSKCVCMSCCVSIQYICNIEWTDSNSIYYWPTRHSIMGTTTATAHAKQHEKKKQHFLIYSSLHSSSSFSFSSCSCSSCSCSSSFVAQNTKAHFIL